jgi:hypothetical protein
MQLQMAECRSFGAGGVVEGGLEGLPMQLQERHGPLAMPRSRTSFVDMRTTTQIPEMVETQKGFKLIR